MIPRDETDADKGPQVDEDHPETGLEEGGVLVADADADGGHRRPAAVVHKKRGEDVLDPGACVAARDADEELEGVSDHGDRDRRQQRQEREEAVPREPRVHAACNEVRN